MDTLFQDLRFTFRSLRKQPVFTSVVVLTLGLAIGANTSAFTLLHGVLWRPLPLPTADRLVALSIDNEALGIAAGELSLLDLDDLRANCSACAAVVGVEEGNAVFDAGQAPERLRGAEVTTGLMQTLAVSPTMGRVLDASADDGGEVVVSHRLWQRHLGEDLEILGRRVMVDGQPRTVVGVMPADFHFPERADLWVPLRRNPAASRGDRDLDGAYVLLSDGATLEQLRGELAGISSQLAGSYPATNTGWNFEGAPLRVGLVGDETRWVLYLMQGAVVFVLLIALANVTNLLLSRQTARRHEVAIRSALGSGGWRIARQLLTESLVLSLLGGALGIALAAWSVDYVRTSSPERLPYWMRLEIHGGVLFFSLAVSTVVALVISVLPAWRAVRPELFTELRRSSVGAGLTAGRQRLQRGLVVGQVALTMVLVFGAGLLLRTSWAMLAADPGFNSRNLVSLRTMLIGDPYQDPALRGAWMEQAIERLEALPGVEHGAFTGSLPLDEGGADTLLAADGRSATASATQGGGIPGIFVSSTMDLFEVLDAPLLSGRRFTAEEIRDPESQVAIINRALADRLWPGENPLGRRLRMAAGSETTTPTVVGVSPDLHYQEIGEASARSRLQVHVPYAASPWRSMTLLVRTTADPRPLLAPIRQQVSALDPSLVIYGLRTLEEVRHQTTWGQRIRGEIFGAFALIALVLGAVGVYGVMSFSVLQRVHEIGVRMAIGADRRSIGRLVLGEGLVLTSVGVGLGLIGAGWVSRLMASVVWGISSTDLATFVVTPLVLLVVALLASYLPARRAASVDPLVALRSE